MNLSSAYQTCHRDGGSGNTITLEDVRQRSPGERIRKTPHRHKTKTPGRPRPSIFLKSLSPTYSIEDFDKGRSTGFQLKDIYVQFTVNQQLDGLGRVINEYAKATKSIKSTADLVTMLNLTIKLAPRNARQDLENARNLLAVKNAQDIGDILKSVGKTAKYWRRRV